jgi:O-succinylhomoserine sulfhydrylase
MGGVIVGSKELMGELVTFLRTAGPTMAPFNAWVFLKGLETLRLRMDAHSSSALTLAAWLQQQQGVSHVYYAGLPTHPQHALAASQQSAFGGVLSFEVDGGQEAAFKFINATRIVSITANLGDAKTTIVHPATTTHGRLSDEQKVEAGIKPNLIRLSIGLEAVADLRVDLQRGLSAL